MQLILEQYRFELRWSTYMCFFFFLCIFLMIFLITFSLAYFIVRIQ